MPFLWFKRRKKSLPSAVVDPEEGGIVQLLPLEERVAQSLSLSEIDDDALRDRMAALLPALFASDAPAYRIIIPEEVKLPETESPKKKGKKRPPLGMKGVPSLRSFEKMAVPSGFTALSLHSSLLSLASFAVGQYHMAQIQARLERIDQRLASLASFQNNEYQSRVLALMAQLQRSFAFQKEILSDPALRERQLRRMDEFEERCMELLGQANLALLETSRQQGLSFSAYEEATEAAEGWLCYSRALRSLLRQIARGEYLLSGGSLSLAQCEAILPGYEKQCREAYASLASWHRENGKRLRIDWEKKRRARPPLVKGVLSRLGLGEKAYQALDPALADCLSDQASAEGEDPAEKESPYRGSVSLIAKEGKLYYEEEGKGR